MLSLPHSPNHQTPSQDARFGAAVGISEDNLVLVGAPGDETAVAFSSNPYTGVLDLCATMTADDGSPGDGYGSSVAINGRLAVVGAPGDDEAATDGGAIFAYAAVSGGAFVFLNKTTSPRADSDAAGGQFGHAVAVGERGVVAVGAPYEPSFETFLQVPIGAAHTLVVDVETGAIGHGDFAVSDGRSEVESFTFGLPFDVDSRFGWSVAIDGRLLVRGVWVRWAQWKGLCTVWIFFLSVHVITIRLRLHHLQVVGAIRDDINGEDTGSVWVFHITEECAKLTLLHKLGAPVPASDSLFGSAVSARGSVIVCISID